MKSLHHDDKNVFQLIFLLLRTISFYAFLEWSDLNVLELISSMKQISSNDLFPNSINKSVLIIFYYFPMELLQKKSTEKVAEISAAYFYRKL